MLVSGRVLPRPPPKVVQSQPKKFGVFGWRMQVVWAVIYYKYTYKKTFLEPICDLYLLKVNPPKECLNSNQKQGWVIWVLGQKYIYIWMIYLHLPQPCHTLATCFFFIVFATEVSTEKITRKFLNRQKSFKEPRIWYTKYRAKGVVCISPANCLLLSGNPKSNKLHPEISP